MKATDRVKIVKGSMQGAVGEVVYLEGEGEDVRVHVYISGVINDLAVQGTFDFAPEDLELA